MPRESRLLAYKNHPLNLTSQKIASAICLDQYHINDILDACDAVALFNSGTGILAMAFEKPVFYYGPVFYAIDGVNAQMTSAAQMRKQLSTLTPVDGEKVRRFFRYLTTEFYSFADWKAETKPASHGKALVPKVHYLYYRSIQIPGQPRVEFAAPSALSKESILMDRFRPREIPSTSTNKTPAPTPSEAAKFSPPQWGPIRRSFHRMAITCLSPLAEPKERTRLEYNPIDFFKKAKWPPNRLFGRLLLDKSQRPY